MQTFLPLPTFDASAACLDDKRLGKQRVEAYQILRALLGVTKGWRNHPATRMWRGFEGSLVRYALAVCREWTRRGHADTVASKVAALGLLDSPDPPWLGDPTFHASHRSNLLRKDAAWYGRFGWHESHDLPYVWPQSTSTSFEGLGTR